MTKTNIKLKWVLSPNKDYFQRRKKLGKMNSRRKQAFLAFCPMFRNRYVWVQS